MRSFATALAIALYAAPATAAAPEPPNVWGDACRAYTQYGNTRIGQQIRAGLKQTLLPKGVYACVVRAAVSLREETQLQCLTEGYRESDVTAQHTWNWRIQRAMELCQPAPAPDADK